MIAFAGATKTYNDGEAQQRTILISGFMQLTSDLSRDGSRSPGRLGAMEMRGGAIRFTERRFPN